MGRYGDPLGDEVYCDYCGYNHGPPHCPSPWGYMPSPETVAATDRALRLRYQPTFVEVSCAQLPPNGDPLDQARYFFLFGKRLLGLDPFELDRWADDGGASGAASSFDAH